MRPTGGVIGYCGMGGPDTVCKFNLFKHVLGATCEFLHDSLNLNVIVLVLHDEKLLFVIKQVEAFASVNLKDTDRHVVFIRVFRIKILNYKLLHSLHSIRLPRASLTIGEASDNPSIEKEV